MSFMSTGGRFNFARVLYIKVFYILQVIAFALCLYMIYILHIYIVKVFFGECVHLYIRCERPLICRPHEFDR